MSLADRLQKAQQKDRIAEVRIRVQERLVESLGPRLYDATLGAPAQIRDAAGDGAGDQHAEARRARALVVVVGRHADVVIGHRQPQSAHAEAGLDAIPGQVMWE